MLAVVFAVFTSPTDTHASVFSFVNKVLGGGEADASSIQGAIQGNSQNTPVLYAALNTNPVATTSSPTIVDDSALVSFQGPGGTAKEVAEKVNADSISTYIVRNGDTLSDIAGMFGVSTQTIL
ncbi:MAG: LysM domain-containing protein, partial [Patescibacteria group bacterium]